MNKSSEEKSIAPLILDKINQENIQCLPQRHFTLRKISSQIIALILILITSCVIAVTYYRLLTLITLRGNTLSLLEITTLILLGVISIGILLTYLEIRKIGRGYRYSISKILMSLFGITLLISLLLFILGVSSVIDKISEERIPFYQSVETVYHSHFNNLKEGTVVGIVTTSSSTFFSILVEKQEIDIYPISLNYLPHIGDYVIVSGAYSSTTPYSLSEAVIVHTLTHDFPYIK
jgi:hypothetical protein